MSASLFVIRLETASDSPHLQHIQFQEVCDEEVTLPPSSANCDVELHPSEWPLLVSDTLLAMHRGQRKPQQITVTTLHSDFIAKEMAALENVAKSGISLAEALESQNMTHELENKTEIKHSTNVSDETDVESGANISKESTPALTSSKEGTPGPPEDASLVSSSACSRSTQKIPFLSGNPTVDITRGILHLYKKNSVSEDERSSLLCVLAVPSCVTIHDLLQFTAPCYPGIQHLRVIRDTSPGQYMILIKFRSQELADEFYQNFNEIPYNSLEPDVLCHLVYVVRVETTTENKDGGLPIPGHTELPTCPVCLERMDETVDGVLTILCNHSFHGECLAKWSDNSCPVCRYCQTVDSIEDQTCSQCGARDSLWICLICGHVGCGRYVRGHAHSHFLETSHIFSLQLGNNRVWDYVRDNYVHRLLQSEGDGKVVSYERGGDDDQCGCRGRERGSDDASCDDASATKETLCSGDEKLSSLQLEYTHLLSSQLESQRQYFEDKLAELAIQSSAEMEECRVLSKKYSEQVEDLQRQTASLRKERLQVDKKLAQLNSKLVKLQNELEAEKQMNANLLESKQESLASLEKSKQLLQKKDAMIADLESQVRDLAVHLDAAASIAADPTLQGGSVALPPEQRSFRGRGGRRRR